MQILCEELLGLKLGLKEVEIERINIYIIFSILRSGIQYSTIVQNHWNMAWEYDKLDP